MAVSFLAVLLAVGGTAVALPGKNTIDKNDINKNAVSVKQIKAAAVGSSEAKNNALRGVDIRESTLGQVQSAIQADSANTAANATNAANATMRPTRPMRPTPPTPPWSGATASRRSPLCRTQVTSPSRRSTTGTA